MTYVSKFVVFLLVFIVFPASGCKDSQMDGDSASDFVVKVTGTATPPAEWTNPKVLAAYPKFDRPFDTALIADITGGKWNIFVEKESDVKFYIINDINNNGSFDYLTEPRVPHADNDKPISIGKTDSDIGEILARRVTVDIQYPAEWTRPMAYIMKGYDIMGYSSITGGKANLFAGSGDDYSVYVFNDNGDGYYNYLAESSYAYDSNTINTTAGDTILNNISIIKVSGTITFTTTLENSYPGLISNLKVALVYPDPWATIESYGTVAGDGTYAVYGNARSKYRLWIFNDLDDNETWNNYEPFVQIPARGSCTFASDSFIDISSGEKTINATLGVLAGTINNNAGWSYPQAGLSQGWDVTAYNAIDSLDFSFMAVQSDDSGTQSYKILLYNDDEPHDGIYEYTPEENQSLESSSYTPDDTSLNLNTS